MSKINVGIQVWRGGTQYTGYNPQLKISSCGDTVKEARNNTVEAIQAFIETASEMGTLSDILSEAGFEYDDGWKSPKVILNVKVALSLESLCQ